MNMKRFLAFLLAMMLLSTAALSETVTIPEAVLRIEDEAFMSDASITQVNINNKLQSIGARAFYDTENLHEIYLPDSVTEIGEDAFDPDTTILCSSSSYARQYAQGEGLNTACAFAVSAIRVEDMTVISTIDARGACLLRVEILDDGDEHVTDERYAPVENAISAVEFSVSFESLPDYFFVRATLVDDAGNALSDSFLEQSYSSKYATFLSKTAADFPADRVLMYSSDSFSVFQESVIIANGSASESDYNVYSESALFPGDKIYLQDANELVKVAHVEQNSDGSYNVTPDYEAAFDEFYSFVRYDETIDISAPQFVRRSRMAAKRSTDSQEADYIFFDGDWICNTEVNVKTCFDEELWGKEYYEVETRYSLEFGYSGAIRAGKPLREFDLVERVFPKETLNRFRDGIPVNLPGVSLIPVVEVPATISMEADANLNYVYKIERGFRYSTVNGISDIAGDDERNKEFYTEGGLSGSIGFRLGGGFSWLKRTAAITASMGVDLEFIAKPSSDVVDSPVYQINDSLTKRHMCHLCLNMELNISVVFEIKLSIRLLEFKKDVGLNHPIKKRNLAKGYVSLINDASSLFGGRVSAGWGECPNTAYRMYFKAYDADGKHLKNTAITVNRIEDGVSTKVAEGTSGFSAFLTPGKYEAAAEFDEQNVKRRFTVDGSREIGLSVLGIPVDESTFPDTRFRSYVSRRIDWDRNDFLTEGEIQHVTSLEFEGYDSNGDWIFEQIGIHSLTGIEYFENLTKLRCHRINVEELDVSGLTKLKEIDFKHTDEHHNLSLKKIKASGCTALETVRTDYCGYLISIDLTGCTALKSLDISYRYVSYRGALDSLILNRCVALESLDCSMNMLTNLELGQCISLKTLQCVDNRLTELKLGSCTTLEQLDCSQNRLTALDLSDCRRLENINCGQNYITALDVSGYTWIKALSCYGNNITSLDVRGCSGLEEFLCGYEISSGSGGWYVPTGYGNGPLNTIDLTGCTALKTLRCVECGISYLDLSPCPNLQVLDVGCDAIGHYTRPSSICNPITRLDVSVCPELTYLRCLHSSLRTVNTSGCSKLTHLELTDNYISTLNLGGCVALEKLDCKQNSLYSLDLSDCINLTEENVAADSSVTIVW